jgi:hypothetical protein
VEHAISKSHVLNCDIDGEGGVSPLCHIFATPPMMRNPKLVEALGAMVPFPQRLGRPEEYASLALEMIRNGYFNGETVRLDGAIRMQPR